MISSPRQRFQATAGQPGSGAAASTAVWSWSRGDLALEAEGAGFPWAAPDDEWVQSLDPWTAGATISLTIEDGSGVIYSDSQTADADGHFHFGLWGFVDLERGHVVTVSDGTTTKTHTVMDLYVDGVDVSADTVFGRAQPGSDVEVWVHDGGNITTTADGSGNWTADFSGTTDIVFGSDGGSQQRDDDGDSTGDWWTTPAVVARPVADVVELGEDLSPEMIEQLRSLGYLE